MRADSFLCVNGYAESRTRAARLISEGKVKVDGRPLKKPSEEIWGDDHNVEITEQDKYVSRGGLKLEAALSEFKIEVEGKRCIDIGASTGGFTDCLLQNGAKSVHCIDSGKDQLHSRVIADPRVLNVQSYNARELSSEEFGIFDIAVMDVSFISQTLIHPALSRVLADGGIFISLIKPQFEAGKKALSNKGIVKDAKDRESAILRVFDSAKMHGFLPLGLINSPIEGGDGNREYLAYFIKSHPQAIPAAAPAAAPQDIQSPTCTQQLKTTLIDKRKISEISKK